MRRGLWFAAVVPTALTMGLEFAHVPSDWASLRVRWELGHTIGFVLFLIAFVLLLLLGNQQVDTE